MRILIILVISIITLSAEKIITDSQIKTFINKISQNNFLEMSKRIFKSIYKKKYKNNLEIFAEAGASNKKQEVSINLKYCLYDNKEIKEFVIK